MGKLETDVVVGGIRGPVIHAAFLLLDLAGDGAAERNVQFLMATADGEQRDAGVERGARQGKGRRVAFEIEGFVFGVRLDAI